jgi:hypothetical protein
MSDENGTTGGGRSGDDHLSDIEDGCGCTEMWEHLSEQRAGGE